MYAFDLAYLFQKPNQVEEITKFVLLVIIIILYY